MHITLGTNISMFCPTNRLRYLLFCVNILLITFFLKFGFDNFKVDLNLFASTKAIMITLLSS